MNIYLKVLINIIDKEKKNWDRNIRLILRLGLIWLIFGGVIRLDWNLKLGFLNFRLGVIVIKFFGVCD